MDEGLERSCRELDERINQHTYQLSNQLTVIESNKLRIEDLESELDKIRDSKVSRLDIHDLTHPFVLKFKILADEVIRVEQKLITVEQYHFNLMPADFCKYMFDFTRHVFSEDVDVLLKSAEYESNLMDELSLLMEAKIGHKLIERSDRTKSIMELDPDSIPYELELEPGQLPESMPSTPDHTRVIHPILIGEGDSDGSEEIPEAPKVGPVEVTEA